MYNWLKQFPSSTSSLNQSSELHCDLQLFKRLIKKKYTALAGQSSLTSVIDEQIFQIHFYSCKSEKFATTH